MPPTSHRDITAVPTMNENSVAVSIVLVGCGAPLKSMGWYHAIQILAFKEAFENGRLEYIVEPWFMSEVGKASPGGAEFHEFKSQLESITDIQFFSRVEDVPAQLNEPNTRRLAIISARTADNPQLCASCLENLGCHAIFLEKPGAPSVVELERMQTKANELGVAIYMGFNKNVSKYVTKTIEYAKNHFAANVTFLHNNNYDESDLNECFERNSEGILKNMAIHELAIAVSFYGVTADNILTVVVDKEFSKCLTLQGPSGQMYTDFSKLKLTILTKYGDTVSIAADRCGGDDSVGIVANHEGEELIRFTMPDVEDATFIKNAEKQMPGAMPYFYVQSPDYLTLKQRVVNAIASSTTVDGVATIKTGLESLKVAEYLTSILIDQFK